MNTNEWNDWTRRAWARVYEHRDAATVCRALAVGRSLPPRSTELAARAQRLHQVIVDGRFGFTKFQWGPVPRGT